MNRSFQKLGFSLVAIAAFSIFTGSLPILVKIDSAIAVSRSKFKPPIPPTNRTLNGYRTGAGTYIRTIDESARANRRLTALVPEYINSTDPDKFKPELTKVWGLTAAEHPTLWFYLPYGQDSISRIDFILRDRDNSADRIVYQTSIRSPTQPGIIDIELPKTSAPLIIDRFYQWELKVTRKKSSGIKEVAVKGWIQRADLDLQLRDSIAQATPEQQVDLYAENGLWYDALSTLAKLRRDIPAEPLHQGSQDVAIRKDWKNMLKSVNLGKLANQPFVR
jgi:Domain of Unknown Function (DUF928)